MNESDIRRMIIKLLILGALEEVFIQMRRGAGSGQISVYIQVYKNAVKIENGKVRVMISQGVSHDDPHFQVEEANISVKKP